MLGLGGCNRGAQDEQADEAPQTEEALWDEAQKQQQSAEQLPLDQHLRQLQEEIRYHETKAFESEEAKLNGVQLLIEEVSQSMSAYSRTDLDGLKKLHEQAKEALYTKETMVQADVMDAYDAKVKAMLDAMQAFKDKTPEFEQHARAKLIYDDIMKADGEDFLIRTRYNRNAAEFNRMLSEKTAEVKALGANFRAMKPYPLFWGEAAEMGEQ
jgi:hypothetical protein